MVPLLRAYGLLLGFSAVSTLLSLGAGAGGVQGWLATAGGALILGLGWAKARVILGAYLGLAAAPFWQRGFETVLALYAALLLGLYVAG